MNEEPRDDPIEGEPDWPAFNRGWSRGYERGKRAAEARIRDEAFQIGQDAGRAAPRSVDTRKPQKHTYAWRPDYGPDGLPETSLPERVVVGANGAYWRDYGGHYSMCPVSEDNDPVEVRAVYVRSRITEIEQWVAEAALAAPRSVETAGLDVERLARALNATVGTVGWLHLTPADPVDEWRENAEAISAEYAALSPDTTETPLDPPKVTSK